MAGKIQFDEKNVWPQVKCLNSVRASIIFLLCFGEKM